MDLSRRFSPRSRRTALATQTHAFAAQRERWSAEEVIDRSAASGTRGAGRRRGWCVSRLSSGLLGVPSIEPERVVAQRRSVRLVVGGAEREGRPPATPANVQLGAAPADARNAGLPTSRRARARYTDDR